MLKTEPVLKKQYLCAKTRQADNLVTLILEFYVKFFKFYFYFCVCLYMQRKKGIKVTVAAVVAVTGVERGDKYHI